MKRFIVIWLCLAQFQIIAQNDFATLRSLQSKTAAELKFEREKMTFDEASLSNFYSAVSAMYKSKDVCVCHKPDMFAGALGAQRKQWFFDLLRQEHIQILSEKVYPFIPTGVGADVVIYFKDDRALVGVKTPLDSILVNEEGWKVQCLVEDLKIFAESRFKHFLDPAEQLKGKITTTSSDGDFLNINSVFDIKLPVGALIRTPWNVTVLNDESKSKDPLFLFVLSERTGEWIRYAMEEVKQVKSGKSSFLQFKIKEGGTYAVAAIRKMKKANVFYYKEKCAILTATLEDPRGDFVGPAMVMDNRRFVCIPTVDYPEDTYVVFVTKDIDNQRKEERLAVGELIRLQSGWYRIVSDVAEKWEERKKAQEEQVVGVNQ